MAAKERVILTNHARLRCAEMEVRTKTVKRVVRFPDIRYVERKYDCWVACGQDLAVAYKEAPDGHGGWLVLTVLWRGKDARWPAPSVQSVHE